MDELYGELEGWIHVHVLSLADLWLTVDTDGVYHMLGTDSHGSFSLLSLSLNNPVHPNTITTY